MKPVNAACILIAQLAVLMGFALSANAEATQKHILRSFILSSHTLKSKIPVSKIVHLSGNRSEVYAENNGYGYAVIAFKSKINPSSLLPKLCNTALTRKYLRPVIADLQRRNISGITIEETLKTYSSKIRLKGVENIGQKTDGNWILYSCRVALKNVHSFKYDGNPTKALALANYKIAKKRIKQKQYKKALAFLKRTTIDADIYKNSVAFIVPIIAVDHAKVASKIEDEYLDYKKISDPDAIYFFGLFLKNAKRLNDAALVFEHCLDVDKNNTKCQSRLNEVQQASTESEIKQSTDFNAFFSDDTTQ